MFTSIFSNQILKRKRLEFIRIFRHDLRNSVKVRELLTEKVCVHGPFRHRHPSGSIPSILVPLRWRVATQRSAHRVYATVEKRHSGVVWRWAADQTLPTGEDSGGDA